MSESGYDATKFGDMFKTLYEIDIDVEELDFPVRVYNMVKRANIHTLQQLLAQSEADLVRASQASFRPGQSGNVQYIIEILKELAESQQK